MKQLINRVYYWYCKYQVIPIDIQGELLRHGIVVKAITKLIDKGFTPDQILRKIKGF